MSNQLETLAEPLGYSLDFTQGIVPLPDIDQLRDRYDTAIAVAADFARHFPAEIRPLLTVGTALANVLRPILHHPRPGLSEWEMLKSVGGPDYNTYKPIDMVGPEIFHRVREKYPSLMDKAVYVEENERWTASDLRSNPPDNPGGHIIWDPVDGSSCIGKTDMFSNPRRDISSGLVELNQQLQLSFGMIVSLVDNRMMFFDGTRMHYLFYQESPNDPSFLEIRPPPYHHRLANSQSLMLATLERRLPALQNLGLFQALGLPIDVRHLYPSLGGEALLTMAFRLKPGYVSVRRPQIDALIDIKKGNGPHEALIWLNMAKAAGFSICGPDGEEINLQGKAADFIAKGYEEEDDRIPYIMGAQAPVNDLILSKLREARRIQGYALNLN